jgi:exopolysaccharide biosynthesis polyprenyl glycosylphosphotransferase
MHRQTTGRAANVLAADRPASLPRAFSRRLRATEHRVLLACGDLVAGVLAVVVALSLWSIPAGSASSIQFLAGKPLWFAAPVLWFLAAALPAASPFAALSISRTAGILARGAAILVLLYLAVYFYSPRGLLPRLVVLYFVWEAFLLTFAWRLIFIAVFSRDRFRSRAIIVGSGPAAGVALDIIRHNRGRHADVDLIVLEDDTPDSALHGVLTVPVEGLQQAVEQRPVSELVLALRRPPEGELLQTLLACQEAGMEIVRVQTLIEQMLHRVPVDLLEPDWLMTDLADAMRLRDASWLGKRAVDILGGLAGVALGAAAAPFIMLAIWLDSGGPIFYRQQRLGRAGIPFQLVKFRTMTPDAERPGEARWAGAADPRVTRVGRFLRRTRLDELPQFLSVVRGEMSLVGPRPERAEFVRSLQDEIPFYRARLMVPPGLTGWAQVNLRYGDSVAGARAKLEYDLYYVKHRTLVFDCAIILRTLGTVVRLRGV